MKTLNGVEGRKERTKIYSTTPMPDESCTWVGMHVVGHANPAGIEVAASWMFSMHLEEGLSICILLKDTIIRGLQRLQV